jgi:hypothetical protein
MGEKQAIEWDGLERRQHSKSILDLEQHIEDMIKAHEVRERIWMGELRDELQAAFPNGDIAGHRIFHERRIEAAKAEEAFWKAAKDEGVKRGVGILFEAVKIVMILSLLGLAYKMGIGPAVAKFFGVS